MCVCVCVCVCIGGAHFLLYVCVQKWFVCKDKSIFVVYLMPKPSL